MNTNLPLFRLVHSAKGGVYMKSTNFHLSVENKFDYMCKRVMQDEKNTYYKQLLTIANREATFSEIGNYIVTQFSTTDTYSTDFLFFNILGFSIGIKNESLVASIEKLSDRKQKILLLYYFLDMTDPEISNLLNIDVSTVNRHRNRSLALIKKYMEEYENEN